MGSLKFLLINLTNKNLDGPGFEDRVRVRTGGQLFLGQPCRKHPSLSTPLESIPRQTTLGVNSYGIEIVILCETDLAGL